jgi:hypothetical protein
MKRYWLLAYEYNYPIGGLHDIKFHGDTIDQCRDAFNDLCEPKYMIFDSINRVIVEENETYDYMPEDIRKELYNK